MMLLGAEPNTMYVNGVVEWVLSLCGFFAAPTPTLPHGGGGRAADDSALAVCRLTPPPVPPTQGEESRLAGIRAAVALSGRKRCAKAHAMAGLTYRMTGKVYVSGVVVWVLSLCGFFCWPHPNPPPRGRGLFGDLHTHRALRCM